MKYNPNPDKIDMTIYFERGYECVKAGWPFAKAITAARFLVRNLPRLSINPCAPLIGTSSLNISAKHQRMLWCLAGRGIVYTNSLCFTAA